MQVLRVRYGLPAAGYTQLLPLRATLRRHLGPYNAGGLLRFPAPEKHYSVYLKNNET